MGISEEKYVALTTFRRNGERKTTPVGITQVGDHVGFTTGSESWKLRRLKNDPRVEMQGCDRKGNVIEGSPVVTGRARKATPEEFQQVLQAVKAKYGFEVTMTILFGKLRKLLGKGPMSDAAVLVTLD